MGGVEKICMSLGMDVFIFWFNKLYSSKALPVQRKWVGKCDMRYTEEGQGSEGEDMTMEDNEGVM